MQVHGPLLCALAGEGTGHRGQETASNPCSGIQLPEGKQSVSGGPLGPPGI